jgi:hypothetical protein
MVKAKMKEKTKRANVDQIRLISYGIFVIFKGVAILQSIFEGMGGLVPLIWI